MKITLSANERRPIPSQGKYLVVRSAEKPFLIQDPTSGLPETEVRAADNIELVDVKTLFAINPHDVAITVDLHISAFPIRTNDGGSVTISGGSIDRINESIQVTASATVKNGTMHVISGASIADSTDKTIAAGQRIRMADSNPNRKALVLQVISASKTTLRVGSDAVSANRGALVAGSLSAPAVMPIETTAELWAYNASDTTATVTVLEVSA